MLKQALLRGELFSQLTRGNQVVDPVMAKAADLDAERAHFLPGVPLLISPFAVNCLGDQMVERQRLRSAA
jgi:hypothetical protein